VAPPLLEGFEEAAPYWLAEEAFAKRFRNSPVLRATRAGMARNVAIALGNSRHSDAINSLSRLLIDPSPIVRGHAAWALGQLLRVGHGREPEIIKTSLRDALEIETDTW